MVPRRSLSSWRLPPTLEACPLCSEGIAALSADRRALVGDAAATLLTRFRVAPYFATVADIFGRTLAATRTVLLAPDGGGRWRVAATSEPTSAGDVIVDPDLYPELVAVARDGLPFLAPEVDGARELEPVREVLARSGIRSVAAFPVLLLPQLAEPVILKVSSARPMTPEDEDLILVVAHLLAHRLATLGPREVASQLGVPAPGPAELDAPGILGLLPLPAAVVGKEGRVIAVNHPAARLIGPSRVRTLRTRPANVWLRGPRWQGELLLGADAQPLIGWSSSVDDANTLVVFDLHPDVRGRKREEILRRALTDKAEELQRAQRRLADQAPLQARFVTDAAHELKTPLAILRSYLDTLLSDLSAGLDENQLGFLRNAQTGALRLQALVDDLLELAAMEKGYLHLAFRPVGLDEAAAEVLDELRPLARDQGIETSRDGPAVHVRADHDRLLQVIRNLVENAIKYTPSGRSVHLSVRAVNDRGILEVSDEGRGIEEQALAHVFDPFFRAPGVDDRSGSGLGLAIARRFVLAMGGRIAVSSELGRGTRFTVELPLWAAST